MTSNKEPRETIQGESPNVCNYVLVVSLDPILTPVTQVAGKGDTWVLDCFVRVTTTAKRCFPNGMAVEVLPKALRRAKSTSLLKAKPTSSLRANAMALLRAKHKARLRSWMTRDETREMRSDLGRKRLYSGVGGLWHGDRDASGRGVRRGLRPQATNGGA
ncbi:unnamed protein product [Euphydryas editha]|uniref:Uncharacterized protein n=1 Tax=Euphydryas editha TaxID=104508 RepID=A0AAU9UT21_EUPED|nr:unnamed protein product [Euphydryas editha]